MQEILTLSEMGEGVGIGQGWISAVPTELSVCEVDRAPFAESDGSCFVDSPDTPAVRLVTDTEGSGSAKGVCVVAGVGQPVNRRRRPGPFAQVLVLV